MFDWVLNTPLRLINYSLSKSTEYIIFSTAWKVSKYGVFPGLYFPAFGLNMERYRVSLRIQSECGKTGIRITPNMKTFHGV